MIREQRLAKKMTLEELAKASGVSRVSINRYELGQRIPNVVIAQKLATALGCSLDVLIEKETIFDEETSAGGQAGRT